MTVIEEVEINVCEDIIFLTPRPRPNLQFMKQKFFLPKSHNKPYAGRPERRKTRDLPPAPPLIYMFQTFMRPINALGACGFVLLYLVLFSSVAHPI